MSQRTTSLRHCGVPMTVTYNYSKARPATLEEPAEEEAFTISSVRIGGVECFTLFGDAEFEDLSDALLEEMQHEADEAADRRRSA
jgi:hypothetical protein